MFYGYELQTLKHILHHQGGQLSRGVCTTYRLISEQSCLFSQAWHEMPHSFDFACALFWRSEWMSMVLLNNIEDVWKTFGQQGIEILHNFLVSWHLPQEYWCTLWLLSITSFFAALPFHPQSLASLSSSWSFILLSLRSISTPIKWSNCVDRQTAAQTYSDNKREKIHS